MIKSNKKLISLIASIAVLLVVGVAIVYAFKRPHVSKAPIVEKKDSVQVIERKFGIPVDSFVIFSDRVERNQFLATILSKYHTDPQQIATLAAKSKDVFDIRNIRAGNHYTVFCSPDSLHKACYFVYQPNPIDYIVYDLRDSVRVYQGKKPVTTQRKETAGVINSSLFEALDNAGASPALAMKMADIYAWDVDFYSIQKGDRFKVIYEEQYVDDLPIGIGTIKSAVFNHDGETFYAFRFHNDSTGEYEYYDEKGRSLRKAFLKAPLKFFRITSHYTRRRFHPIQHRWKAHLGTDYAAPTGTPIMSTAAGVVIASQYTRFNGNYVKVRHNSVYTTQYLHMSKRAVRVGQHVRQGQIIGYVGSTGLATGPHVCYRFWKNGKQVNPLTQKFPAANPVPDEDRVAFAQAVEKQKLALSAMSLDTTLLASAE